MMYSFRRILSVFLSVCLVFSSVGPSRVHAQLPEPGTMVALSAPVLPVSLVGLKVFPSDPFRLDFILDKGSLAGARQNGDMKADSERLVKYFLAGLTIPQDDIWVNLSPYEGDRIITPTLGRTDLGRDLLEQDYVLKQVAASVLYPQGEAGKKFWAEVYARAHEKYGTIDIPVDTYNKVWIVPERAKVFENKDRVFVVESRLKVLLESDYLAEEKQKGVAVTSEESSESQSIETSETRELMKSVMREIIIPILEREVNEGANFTTLRQVYHSLILAIWYKNKIHDTILSAAYVNKGKVNGVTIDDPQMAKKVWAQYVEAFKKGAYNYVSEEVNPDTQELIPRKYVSGGMGFRELKVTDSAQAELPKVAADRFVRLRIENRPVDNAMATPGGVLGYIEDVRARVSEGGEVVLRAVMPDMTAETAANYRVIVHSNRGGAWKDGETLDFVGVQAGKAVFETRIKAERGFEYTFVFERKSDGYRSWADIPFGNGTVIVDRQFQGSVVFAGMEFGPLVKKGGQGDVMYELPRNEVKAGVKATVVIPYFKKYAAEYARKGYVIEDVPGITINVDFKRRPSETMTVKKTVIDGITIYLLDAKSDDLFVEPYRNSSSEFYESILLSQGTPELLEKLGAPVDIVQYNDHHAALVPLYMSRKHGEFFAKTGRVFTIHNIGYQGEYQDTGLMEELGLGSDEQLNNLVVKSGKINFMAVPPGIAKAEGYRGHYVGTVSPTYAEEIRHTQFALDRLLNEMGTHFGGVMNGIDTEVNNPYTNPVLRTLGLPNYRIEQGIGSVVSAKTAIKNFLRNALRQGAALPVWETGQVEKFGYLTEVKPGEPERLMVGYVGRNVRQKQIDIIVDVVQDMVDGKRPPIPMDVVMAVASDKSADDQDSVPRLISLIDRARAIGVNVVVLSGFLKEASNLVYSGLDAMLMPSDFEPAGIVQQLSKRYGTVPIVRLTGGLADTVFEGGADDNGFVFPGTFRRMDFFEDAGAREQNAYEFYQAVGRAAAVFYGDQNLWRTKIENGMNDDSSWARRQKDYLNVYSWLQEQMKDNAQLAPGGIDLTSDRLQVESYGQQVEFTGLWSQDGLAKLQINGLTPAVISMAPEADLSGFLGVSSGSGNLLTAPVPVGLSTNPF